MLKKKINPDKFKGSRFGLERETLRVTMDGKLAQSAHPFEDPALSRDFCENQLEIITPVCDSIEESIKCLEELDQKAREMMQEEILWLYSNPPFFSSEDEIPVANYKGSQIEKYEYRLKLQKKYGKKLMTYSGIHFNMSFPEEVQGDCKDAFYMKLLKYTLRYSWLLTFLTAASPIYDASLKEDNKKGTSFSGYASMRNSVHGYWNHFTPILDYSNLQKYCDSIQKYLDQNLLIIADELYLPVRIKSKGQNSLEHLREGIDHIELRMFDLNPFEKLGIAVDDLRFTYYLLLYFSTLEDFTFTEEMQREAVQNHKNAALYEEEKISIQGRCIVDAARDIMMDMARTFYQDRQALDVIYEQLMKLKPGHRYVNKVYDRYHKEYQMTMLSDMKKRSR